MNKPSVCQAIVMLLACGTLAPVSLIAAPGDVAMSLDCSCPYPSGLACDGTLFYVADWRNATIHRLAARDHQARQAFPAPTLMPSGLACGQGKLFVSDDHTGLVYTIDPDSGTVLNTFEAPASRATGLAYHNDKLFILARRTIYTVLPEDGTILNYFEAPSQKSRHLTHDGRYLWVTDRIKDEVYMLDPNRGTVINILPAPGPHAAGIAWHDNHLYNVDFQTHKIYQLIIRDDPMYRLDEPRRARVEYLWSLNNYGPGTIKDLTVALAMPVGLPSQKLLSGTEVSVTPDRAVRDRWDQLCAIVNVPDVPAGQKRVVTYWVHAEVSAIRHMILPEAIGTLNDTPDDIRRAYTVDGSHYRIDTPYMKELARRIVGDETNAYWVARRIYDHIIAELHYEMIGGWDVPEVVLKRGSGSCSEYTYTFVALCRAAGLPARYQGGIVVRGDDASIDEAFHRWAQVYLPGHGWVPVDANAGDAKRPADQGRGFGGLPNRFLVTTQGGGDSEYLRWGYNAHTTYKATGRCNVQQDSFGFWSPLEVPGAQDHN